MKEEIVNQVDSVEANMSNSSKNENDSNINNAPLKDRKNVIGLIKNVLLNNIYQILIIIVPLITTPYVSRVLQPSGVGISSYTNSLVTYFTMIAALGTVGYGTREIARARDNKQEMSRVFWEIELITVITSVVCLIIWLGVCFVYKKYQLYLFLWTFCIFGTLFDISWLYAGLEKYKYTISVNAFFKVAGCVLIFTFVKTADDLWKYVLIYSLSSLFGNLSMWGFLPMVLVKAKPNVQNLKKHFKETLIYFIPVIANVLYAVLDKTLIGAVTQNTDYSGQYESATKVINLCKVIGFSAIVSVMSSRSNYLFKIKESERIKSLTMNTLNLTMGLSIAVTFGVISVSNIFVPLFFGTGYEMTVTLMNILAPVVIILAVIESCGGLYYIPAGKRLQSAEFLLVGALVNLVLNVVLIKYMGPSGACISTLIAEGVIALLYVTYCKTVSWLDLLKISWKKVIAGAVMYIALFFFAKVYIENVYLELVLRVLIGAIVYFVVLFVLKDRIFKIIKEVKSV